MCTNHPDTKPFCLNGENKCCALCFLIVVGVKGLLLAPCRPAIIQHLLFVYIDWVSVLGWHEIMLANYFSLLSCFVFFLPLGHDGITITPKYTPSLPPQKTNLSKGKYLIYQTKLHKSYSYFPTSFCSSI